MAEYCYTNYIFYSDEEESLKAFRSNIQELSSKCSDRLCNIANVVLGSSNPLVSEIGGTIECISSIEGNAFQIDVETKYTPDPRIWDEILKAYPDIRYVYRAEEPEFGVFINTDSSGKYFPEKYYAALIQDEEVVSEDYFETESDLLDTVHEWMLPEVPGGFRNFDDLIAFRDGYNNTDEDNCLKVYKYKNSL